jgi:chemotaxis protein CheD
MKTSIHIHIGGLHASRGPAIIDTTLGSCVAVCLHDPQARIGGMNHILLPGKADLLHFDSAARYGVNAMELLINRIMAIGGNRLKLVAKVFGGAHISPEISIENGVGKKNAEFVVAFLQMENIRIIGSDLGGHESRTIYFYTDTGEVFLKRGVCASYPKITEREKKLMNKIRKQAEKPASITLFQDTVNKNRTG